ncbi:MAG TPA: cytochrome c maturation protein CcmE [Candidatus Saccharimonadales bacterium]|jgi:cytochrome c-type biogenesis protein CcmE|nr:cytochrome c maturation protein CcmE [Candidatus Saccharimonadales bacterium]
MNSETRKYVRFGVTSSIIVLALGYLAYTGYQESKDYYVTIKELRKQGDDKYTKRLRVGGNVQPGSIRMAGSNADFVIVEKEKDQPEEALKVSYKGSEPPPDTFKDNAQALVMGEFGKDGVFHAHKIEAKCASKYAPKEQQQQSQPTMAPAQPSKGY